jgi:hypothetical protein
MFDHYSYRTRFADAPLPGEAGPLPAELRTPPRTPGEQPWWREYFVPGVKQRDRQLFG